MSIRPYRNLVVGKRIQEKLFYSKRLIAPERLNYKIPDLVEVVMQGPDCTEDLSGKIVMLPTWGGTEIQLTDTETGEEEKYVVIAESELLAIIDEELISA